MPTIVDSSIEAKQVKNSRIYFSNLNGLRFIAVAMVIFNHLEGGLYEFGLPTFFEKEVLYKIGQLGVTIFFVLSGFLITYLLLLEKNKLGRIEFGAFYIRRALRIWPLYYVTVILGLFVLPNIDFFYYPNLTPFVTEYLPGKILLYGLILPNIVAFTYKTVPYLPQLWSIGVEEQFYIIWPILIYLSKNYLRSFLVFAGVTIVCLNLIWGLTAPERHILPINQLTTFIKVFLMLFRVQSMAIGGIFALIIFSNWKKTIKILTSKAVQVMVWSITILLIFLGFEIPKFTYEMYSFLFGIIILNLSLEQTSIVKLQNRLFDYLGRISYGLYMLHSIAIVTGIRIASSLVPASNSYHHLIMVVITIATSVLLASVSYYYLEMPFLRLKKKFAFIESGPQT